jgi:4-oxalocrotonate tautomerase
MPILTVKVSGEKSQDLTNQIGALLMDLTSRILKKKREVTAIAIEYVGHDSWFVGGNLHEESYIHVQDVRATSYGFGGKTQEYRYYH